tara:strand:- start:18191 stop:20017 length:1827 start_codon:yes stop_codon:yes gene_type:complete
MILARLTMLLRYILSCCTCCTCCKKKVRFSTLVIVKEYIPEILEESKFYSKYIVSDDIHLRNYLILGSSDTNYKTKSPDSNDINVNYTIRIRSMIDKGMGVYIVKLLLEYSDEGRAAKQTAIYNVLALCCHIGDEETKKEAWEAMPHICRIPPHLFEFVIISECIAKELTNGSGWGRAKKRAITRWYTDTTIRSYYDTAKYLTKYRKHKNWTHRDVIRKGHVKGDILPQEVILAYAVHGIERCRKIIVPSTDLETKKIVDYFEVIDSLSRYNLKNSAEVSSLGDCIVTHRLVHENLKSLEIQDIKSIWLALFKNMPYKALLRYLPKLTLLGIFEDSYNVAKAIDKIQDPIGIQKSRIHPLDLLKAVIVYSSGGKKGKSKHFYTPIDSIVSALNISLEISFGYCLKITNKKIFVAVDVSGSMEYYRIDNSITCRDGAIVSALTIIKKEPSAELYCFSTGDYSAYGRGHSGIMKLPITKDMTFNQALEVENRMPFSGTDCSLPMQYAIDNELRPEVFIILTDNETNCNQIPPSEAISNYRKISGIDNAKLIVVAMTSNNFTIADPNDENSLDVTGFNNETMHTIVEYINTDSSLDEYVFNNEKHPFDRIL